MYLSLHYIVYKTASHCASTVNTNAGLLRLWLQCSREMHGAVCGIWFRLTVNPKVLIVLKDVLDKLFFKHLVKLWLYHLTCRMTWSMGGVLILLLENVLRWVHSHIFSNRLISCDLKISTCQWKKKVKNKNAICNILCNFKLFSFFWYSLHMRRLELLILSGLFTKVFPH